MQDRIGELLEALKRNHQVIQADWTNSFLNKAGDIFEKGGFGVLEAFLLPKIDPNNRQDPAKALMEVLSIMRRYEEVHNDRQIGRMVIKGLLALSAQGSRE